MSTISIIAAIADKSAIGKNQQLLCHMPSDMKRFKELTTGHAVFIIGGALVYRQALRIADKMYITRIHHEFPDATSFFPVVNWDLWEETEREEYPADEKNPYPYTYITYVRKK